MDRNEILQQTNEVMKDVFDNEDIQANEATVAADIDEWDSLTHVLLIVAIEKHFGVKFSSREIQAWQNVGEIMDTIQKKL